MIETACDRTLSAFRDADWTFATRARSEEFHPYPARYIPEIPRQVIELAAPGAGPIFDPFCGSGTTLFAARSLGYDAIGNDINPVACLISRVRSTPLTQDELASVRDLAAEVVGAAREATSVGATVQAIPRVDHWFDMPSQLAMAGATRALVGASAPPRVVDAVRAGISAATVRISKQESDTRYAAVEQNRSQDECASILGQSLSRVASWIERHSLALSASAHVTVGEGDAQKLDWIPDESVGLACFSPPYPNAYEYWLYHKYRMYWLGFDPIAVRNIEMGARPHYSKKNGLDESDFQAQMTNVYRELGRVLRPGALSVALIGDSVIAGRLINNGELLASAAGQASLRIVGIMERPIAVNRSSFNRAHSRARSSEHIVIVRKIS